MAAVGKESRLLVPQLSLFLFIAGVSMHFTITQLMILNKTCLASGYDNDVCQDLSQHPDAEDEVQAKAATWSMKLPILSFVPAAFMTLVFGPFSDVYGRKKILLIPIFCNAIGTMTMFIQSNKTTLSPFLLYGGNLMMGLGGGMGTFVSTLLNYVTDSTSAEHRTERLSLVMPFMALGQTVGSLCNGILWDTVGPSAIYLLTLITQIAIVVSVSFFLEESTKVVDEEKQSVLSLRGIFDNMTAGWRVVTAERQRGQRRRLLILFFIGLASMFCMSAQMSVVALYTRRVPFQWTPTILSYFTASKTVMNVIGTVAVTKLYIKLTGSRSDQGDLTLMCIGFGAAAVQFLVMATAPSSSYLILMPFLATFRGPVNPASKSLTSKLVSSSETGALNSFVAFLNTLALPLGSVMFVSLYTKTVQTIPGAVFIAIMAIQIVCFLLLIYLKKDFISSQVSEDQKEK